MGETYGRVGPEILEELKEIAGEKNLIFEDKEKLADYGADTASARGEEAHPPEVVVKPDSTEQISEIMRLANRCKIPVTPRGAGSGLGGAAVPLFGGIVISLERMNRILEIDAVDRVAVVEPGVITNEVCKKVEEQGFMYAGYPMSTHSSFIGGNVATNAGGGKVIRYGNTRRHVLGLEVVLPTGEVIALGGRYRKSTWGYNLLQLMIGSEGTLGIFTKIIVNLIPSSGKSVDLLVPFSDTETAVKAVASLIVSGGVLPESVEYMDRLCIDHSAKRQEIQIPFQGNPEAEAFLIIRVCGESSEGLEDLYEKAGEACLENGALDVFVADSRRDSDNIWKVREEFAEGLREADPHIRLGGDIVVPFSRVSDMMKELKKLGEKYHTRIATTAHIADGNLHSAVFKPADVNLEEWPKIAKGIFNEMTELAVGLGGVGGGEHGVGFVKKPIFLKTKPEAELTLMRGIKKVFDPHGILNPGKII